MVNLKRIKEEIKNKDNMYVDLAFSAIQIANLGVAIFGVVNSNVALQIGAVASAFATLMVGTLRYGKANNQEIEQENNK